MNCGIEIAAGGMIAAHQASRGHAPLWFIIVVIAAVIVPIIAIVRDEIKDRWHL